MSPTGGSGKYAETSGARGVSAVIRTYEAGDFLLRCLQSLHGQPSLLETIVVDNGSSDGSLEAAVAHFPDINLVNLGRNAGPAVAANLGARRASGELLLFLDPDVELPLGSVAALAEGFDDSSVGVVGPPLEVARIGRTEYGYTIDPLGSTVGLTERAPALYVSNCALMTRADVFHELGGFDERFFMLMEEVDYCWRALLRGFDIRIANCAAVWHAGGAATPGGYIVGADFASTRFRIVLRERNTLAMLIRCYSLPLLLLVVPLYVAQSLATAAALAATGRLRTARGVCAGVWWNFRHARRTIALRQVTQRSRLVSDRVVLKRMYRGIWKIALLLRFGMPTVSEDGAAPLDAAR